ncbi:MAG: hypothetical protein AAFV53_06240 [Myxococcota bacterium]
MSEAIEEAAAQARQLLKKLRAGKGKLQGNFYFAGNAPGTVAGLVVTLLSRDKKGRKALAAGKDLRKEIPSARFARGTVTIEKNKLIFTLHAGSASAGQLKKAFQKTLSQMDGLKLLRDARIRLAGADASEDDVIDPNAPRVEDEALSTEDAEALASEVQALIHEQAELAEEQGGLSALNAQLSAFLSQEDADREQAEQIMEHLEAVERLKRQRPRDEKKIHAAQAALAQATAVTGTGFPSPGQAVPPQLANVLELAADMLSETRPRGERQSQRVYEKIRGQLDAQLSVYAAFYGEDKRYRRIRSEMAKAHREVLTAPNPPDFERGIPMLEAVLAKTLAVVSKGQQVYSARRRDEAALEQQRLAALKAHLRGESEHRVLLAEIKTFEDALDGVSRGIEDVIRPLTDARRGQEVVAFLLEEDVFDPLHEPLDLNTGARRLRAAANIQADIEEGLAETRRQLVDARDAFDALVSTARSDTDTGPMLERHDALARRLENEHRLTAEQIAVLDKQRSRVRQALLQAAQYPENRRKILRKAQGQLLEIEQRYDTGVRTYQSGYGAASKACTRAGRALGRMMSLALPSAGAPLFARLEAARDQLEAGDFDDAREAADTLRAEIDGTLPALQDAKKRWDAFDVADLEQRIQAQRETGLAFPDDPMALGAAVQQIVAGVMQRSAGYADGLDELQDIDQKVSANAREVDDMEKLKGDLAAARTALRATAATLRRKVEEDHDAEIVEAMFAPFEARELALLQESHEARNAVQLTLNIQALGALEAEVKAAGQPDALPGNIDTATLSAARNAVKAQREAASEVLERLRALGEDELGELRREVDTELDDILTLDDPDLILELAEAFASGRLEELKRHQASAERNVKKLKKKLTRALRAARAALKRFDEAVTTDQSAWFQWARSDQKQEYVRYVGTLKEEYKQLRLLASGDYPGLMKQNILDLHRFKRDVQVAMRGLADQSGKAGTDTHTALRVEIESVQIVRLQDNQTVTELYPAAQKALIDKLNALKDRLGSELLALSQKAYRSISQEIEGLFETANNTARQRLRFQRRASQIEAKLTAPDQPIAAFETLTAKLTAQLEAARALSTREGKLPNATEMLTAISSQIERAADSDNLVDMVRAHDQQVSEDAQLEVEWEADLGAFNRELFDPFQKAVDGDKSYLELFAGLFVDDVRIREVKDLRQMAMDSAENDDFQMARYQLSLARSRMELHMRFPEGQDAAMIASLQKVPGLWRGAIRAFEKNLDEVAGAIAGVLANKGDADAGRAVTDAATSLKTLLRQDAFDPAIAAMTRAGLSEDAKRAARERGLAVIRAQRERLTDPRLRILASHPFDGAGRFHGHFQVGKVLTDAEKTILLNLGS